MRPDEFIGFLMGDFDFASTDVLLGIDEVCQKLSISRSTLERLRRRQSSNSLLSRHSVMSADEFSGLPPFPEPTIVLGRSPRWSAKILNAWLDKSRRLF
jgi:predicted DNA-binding transcriptional regulator AlpA